MTAIQGPSRTAAKAQSRSSSAADWTPTSWRSRPAQQMPAYDDAAASGERGSATAPLSAAGLRRRGAQAQGGAGQGGRGEAFLLQGGDCAESFADFTANNIRDTFRVLLQMAVVLTYGAGVPMVKLGRMAGQFAKPRSSNVEKVGGVELPSYRGDNVNGFEFTAEARKPDPERMVQAYNQSAATLNLLRAFAQGGYADLHEVNRWNLDFVANSPASARYQDLAARLDETLNFMAACGLTSATTPQIAETDFFTSHEALLLQYEEALTRVDSTSGDWYDCSAHLLWIGDRTRQPDGAHVEFLRGVRNPLGFKCGPSLSVDDMLQLIDTLNPANEPGRIVMIARMGADNVADEAAAPDARGEARRQVGGLVVRSHARQHRDRRQRQEDPPLRRDPERSAGLLRRAPRRGHSSGRRAFRDDRPGSHRVRRRRDRHHGREPDERYETQCDPRLNASQALELAFLLAEQLKAERLAMQRARPAV